MGLKVLIVEDEYLVALHLQMQLSRAGYRVLEPAASAEKVLAIAQQEPPDVVLMDLTLAGKMDGLEAARLLLAQQAMAMIFITGHNDEEMLSQLRSLNPVAILPNRPPHRRFKRCCKTGRPAYPSRTTRLQSERIP